MEGRKVKKRKNVIVTTARERGLVCISINISYMSMLFLL